MKVLKDIETKKIIPVKIPAQNATALDQMKFNICQKIILFKLDNHFSGKDLAKILGVTPAMVCRIVHCDIGKFKIDSLLYYYESLLIANKDKAILAEFNKTLKEFLKQAAHRAR
jgi:predicted XRE-type DNA-binding protein